MLDVIFVPSPHIIVALLQLQLLKESLQILGDLMVSSYMIFGVDPLCLSLPLLVYASGLFLNSFDAQLVHGECEGISREGVTLHRGVVMRRTIEASTSTPTLLILDHDVRYAL